MTDEPHRMPLLRGAAAGLLAGAVAVGAGQFAASFGAPVSSPVVAVGQAAIDLTPPPVKNFAISTFGSNDKVALQAGILIVLAIYAAAIGVLGTRRLAYSLIGLAVFAGIGFAAAGTRPGSNAGYFVPTIVAAAGAALTLILLLRNGRPRPAAATPAASQTAPAAGKTTPAAGKATPAAGTAAAASGRGEDAAPGQPGGGWVPATPAAAALAPQPRRQFLVTSGGALGVAAAGWIAGRVISERGAVSTARAHLRIPRPAELPPRLPPGTDLHIPGLSEFITPNQSFYRVDTALLLPQVAPETWRLRIHGMVEREIDIDFAELLRRPLIETYVTLACVSDPVSGPYIGNARWIGASLAGLIRQARPRAGADQILSTSVDGFTCGTPVQTVLDGRDALLAVAMNGLPLPVEHGFPARMVVPGLYGYVSATKWVTDIKLTTFAAEAAYWAQRGWSQQAPIKTESRIDVPDGTATLRAGRRPVAGVAWAQHKGIDMVQVRVDGGLWQEARLAAVPGIDTWRQWVWYWDATPGAHTIEARATDATGYTQTAVQTPPEPNGATGYPSVTVQVR